MTVRHEGAVRKEKVWRSLNGHEGESRIQPRWTLSHFNPDRACYVRDEGRSLGTGVQAQVSNHPQAAAIKSRGGERWGKRQARTCQVWVEKTSESEPLMRRRKRRDAIETRLLSLAWDKVWGKPVYCPDGDRRKGGVSSIQALAWNMGTCRLDGKGELQVVDP